jgi:glycosyltransferase involved in cell wall biosynthesis
VDETIKACKGITGVHLIHLTPERGGGSKEADEVYTSLPYERMSALYSSVDLLVKMSRVEGMFGPPLEAFHSGTPAILSKVTGFDEFAIDNFNSLVVDVDDFQGMTSSLEYLSTNPNALSRLSEGALATARDWPSLAETAADFVSVVYSVLSSAGNSAEPICRMRQFSKALEEVARGKGDPKSLVDPLLLPGVL